MGSIKRIWLVVLSILLSSTVATLASTEDLDVAIFKAFKLSQERLSPDERNVLASAMLAYWKSFDSRIPRSSPETQKWLEEELQTTDTARLGRVISTPEFALRELSSLSSHCVDFIPLLQTSIGSDKATELFYWLKITQCYVNVSDVMNKLKTAGLSNGQIDGPFHVAHFGTMIPVLSGKIANSILTGYTGQ